MTGETGLDLEQHQQEALDQMAKAPDEGILEQLRIQFLGRKAALSQELSRVGSLPPGERRQLGQKANTVKRAIQELKIPTVGGAGSVTAALPPRAR